MTTRTADAEGFVTDDSIAYYMARVRGGTGLITVEMASPERAGRHRRHEVGIYDDRFIPGLTRLVSAPSRPPRQLPLVDSQCPSPFRHCSVGGGRQSGRRLPLAAATASHVGRFRQHSELLPTRRAAER